MAQNELATELELICASLLPSESLESIPDINGWPRLLDIKSSDSKMYIHVGLEREFENGGNKPAVTVEIKGDHMGRAEALQWGTWVEEKMDQWDSSEDYPLYQLLTTHFLPLLAPKVPSPSPVQSPSPATEESSIPHHALLISHHLLSSTKRKNLISLSSSLSLVGFSKPGHPGIMYAIGELSDLEQWIREVRSWNWLALRVRLPPCPIPEEKAMLKETKGKEDGARGGKGRGEWVELEKVGETLEWLRRRGGEERARVLLDVGVGGGTGGKE